MWSNYCAKMSIACPFARLSVNDKAECPARSPRRKGRGPNSPAAVRDQAPKDPSSPKCPVSPHERKHGADEATVAPKCPLGYDSVSFKIGPLSCVICRALLFDTSRCVPCQHIFCRWVLCNPHTPCFRSLCGLESLGI